MLWPIVLSAMVLVATVDSHGRVTQPPSRASAWRVGFPTRPDYDDDGVNCGGMWHQWGVNRGRCGICGDRYDARLPRPHELGGIFGAGVIVAHYHPGSVITTTVHLTTSHLGYWEFKLCPDPKINDQECFDRYLLQLEEGGTKYYPKRGSVKYNVNYRLPAGVVCEHCVLQWKYTAGNNWGVCSNGTQGLGCGNQEQFGACSDISIGVSKFGSVNAIGYGDSPLLYHLSRGYYDKGKGIILHAKGDNGLGKNHLKSSASRKKNKVKQKKQRRNKKKTKPYKVKKCLRARARGVPASRASAWRVGYNTVPNYDDDGCNCGGFYHQWEVNGGKCGICGDPYDAPAPRANELGGTYGQGVIVGEYSSGSVIDVTVVITAYHLGYWEFKICPDPINNEQECFEQYLLELEDGGTKYYPKGSGRYEVRYRLPDDLVCEHCVLQWKYTTGNNWGDCKNGTQGLGCGNQENFGACSDITITSADDSNNLPSDNMPLLLGTLLSKRDD